MLRWFRDNLGFRYVQEAAVADADFYSYVERNISNTPSSVLVLPHFNGSGTPLCDMQSKGAFVGLTLSSSLEEIFKGMLDGLTYELKQNVETMRNSGIMIREIRAIGGGAKSHLWMQVKADILDMPIVTLVCKEAGCLGAAVLAAVGGRIYKDIPEAVSNMVHIEQTWMPDRDSVEKYAEKYEIYKTLYPAIKTLNTRL